MTKPDPEDDPRRHDARKSVDEWKDDPKAKEIPPENDGSTDEVPEDA